MKRNLLKMLVDGRCSLLVAQGRTLTPYYGRGIADLYRLLTGSPEVLRKATVADKVVGKGAAALMAEGGISVLHAIVVSTPALALLRSRRIKVHYQMEVPHIINRQGDDICPVEKLCHACATPADCVQLITTFMTQIRQ